MRYLLSAFSLQMVAEGATIHIGRTTPSRVAPEFSVREVAEDKFAAPPDTVVAVGHEGTAKAMAAAFGWAGLPVNRQAITLKAGDVAYIAQPVGARLAPGVELTAPDLTWFVLTVHREDAMDRRRQAYGLVREDLEGAAEEGDKGAWEATKRLADLLVG